MVAIVLGESRGGREAEQCRTGDKQCALAGREENAITKGKSQNEKQGSNQTSSLEVKRGAEQREWR